MNVKMVFLFKENRPDEVSLIWQSNMKLVRISGITTGILYGSYYIYYHSWFMVLGDFILLLTGIYTLYKNDIRRKSNNEVICN